ncbi:MAG: hypothetical protein NTZ34_13590 [Chloroflexi bacterium]|nr:hypothetical protein [Chloroflexota bacterium]
MKVLNHLILLTLVAGLLLGVVATFACNTRPTTLSGKIAKGIGDEMEKQIQERMPRVDVFKFDSYEALSGENVTLSWKVRQADNVTIYNSLGAIEPVGSSLGAVEADGSRQFVFPLTGKTTLAKYVYTLTASNKYGKVTDNATVMVIDENLPPGIYFDVSSPQMHLGKGARLEWNTSRATEVSMDDGSGVPSVCKASGQKIVYPLKTTTYTLTAVNKNGKTVKSLTLEVIPAD